jgi:sulfur relay protein TusB/DsrH
LSSTLFTLSESWHDSIWLFEQLAFASEGDAILLLQDSVLGLQSATTLASFTAKCESKNVALYALKDDVDLRGITNYYSNITLISYQEFVGLVVNYEKQVAW